MSINLALENDYVPNEAEVIPEEEQSKKPKKTRLNVKKDKRVLTKKEKPNAIQKKSKIGKSSKSQEQISQFEDIEAREQVASDVSQEVDAEQNKENYESTT